jgi:hypothetical protein
MSTVTIVYTQDWDSYSLEGIFSSPEKAQAYIDMVAAAEKSARVLSVQRQVLQTEDIELDELVGIFPVFVARTTSRLGPTYPVPKGMTTRVMYLKELPPTNVYRTDDGFTYAVEVFAASPAEAKAKLAAAKTEYFTG